MGFRFLPGFFVLCIVFIVYEKISLQFTLNILRESKHDVQSFGSEVEG